MSDLSDIVIDRILRDVGRDDKEYVARIVEGTKRLFASAAAHVELVAALITCADDPMHMVRVLTPVIADDKGVVPALYWRLAEHEVQKRTARAAAAH